MARTVDIDEKEYLELRKQIQVDISRKEMY